MSLRDPVSASLKRIFACSLLCLATLTPAVGVARAQLPGSMPPSGPRLPPVEGAPLPSVSPELVGPTTISTGNVYRGSFTPDGDTLYFFRKTGEGEEYRIFRSVHTAAGWGEARQFTIQGDHSDLYPTISADGRRMVFASYRPIAGDTSQHRQAHLWQVERVGGAWGAPVFLDEVSRRGWHHSQPRLLGDGTLTFLLQTGDYRNKQLMSARPDADSYPAPTVDSLWTTWRERVPPGMQLFDLSISPDGSYVVLGMGRIDSATRRAGPSDLWIARRERDGGWRAPVPFAPSVNTDEFENFPFWSPDGRTLYFVRGFARLYRLAIDELPGAETSGESNAATRAQPADSLPQLAPLSFTRGIASDSHDIAEASR